jgi:Protein of unknown function (DUF2442)
MKITDLKAGKDWRLIVTADDGRVGSFDLMPFLKDPAFKPLRARQEFLKFFNRGTSVKWASGGDLPADTIESRWRVFDNRPTIVVPAAE